MAETKTKKALVTGGAGFLGSNLVHKLVADGVAVTVVDNFHPDYGANEYNFEGIREQMRVVRGDITDLNLMRELASGVDTIFHIAAQCSHVDSMIDPWRDLDYNCRGTLSVLEAARLSPTKPVIVNAATRAVLGAPAEIPVTERTLPNPTDIYGVNKLAAETYGAVYARVHRIPFVSLRLTNSYGPRHQMKNGKYGILNWFISLALQGKTVKVFGTGEQLRDYIYIDDATDAFVRAATFVRKLGQGGASAPVAQLAGENVPFAVFNIASGRGLKFVDCAKAVTKMAGSPLEMVPWPADRKAIETGDFVADCTQAEKALGWIARESFDAGLARTFDYYRKHLKHYL